MTFADVDGQCAPIASSTWHLPRLRRFSLDNGLRLVWAEHQGAPLFHALARVGAGAAHDPPGAHGLAALTTASLKAGAGDRDATTLAAALELTGADLVTGAEWDDSSVALELLARDAAFGTGLLADVLWRPLFDPGVFESVRGRRATRRRNGWSPTELARRLFARAVYGPALYGRPRSGDEESLLQLTRRDVLMFHQQYFAPGATLVVAVGGDDPDGLARQLDRASPSAWQPTRTGPDPVQAPIVERSSTVVFDRPHAPQTVLRIGHAGLPAHHAQHACVELLLVLLAARIERTLRDRLGQTYGVRSELGASRGPAPLSIGLSVPTPSVGDTVREVTEALERVRSDAVDHREILAARGVLQGGFLRSLQPAHGVARYLAGLAASPSLDRWRALQQLGDVDAQGLRAIALCHLRPDRLTVVAVGPAAPLNVQLAWRTPLLSPPDHCLP